MRELSRASAPAMPHPEALRVRDDVAFLPGRAGGAGQARPGVTRPQEEVDHAVRQIISRAVAPEGGVDIFAAAGLRKNVVRARSFAEMLEQTIRRYQPDDRGGAGDAAPRCWSSESCASTATARQVGEGHRDCAGAGPAALRTVGGDLTPVHVRRP
jgi:Type I restriction enzyme HindI endonuclease subunit-like, C-terminal